MKEFTYTVKDPEGIHARPAGKITACAKLYSSFTTLWIGEKSYDLKMLLQFMGCGLKQGDKFVVRVEGNDEDACAAALQNSFAENL